VIFVDYLGLNCFTRTVNSKPNCSDSKKEKEKKMEKINAGP
jgi:hypothetical protein